MPVVPIAMIIPIVPIVTIRLTLPVRKTLPVTLSLTIETQRSEALGSASALALTMRLSAQGTSFNIPF